MLVLADRAVSADDRTPSPPARRPSRARCPSRATRPSRPARPPACADPVHVGTATSRRAPHALTSSQVVVGGDLRTSAGRAPYPRGALALSIALVALSTGCRSAAPAPELAAPLESPLSDEAVVLLLPPGPA